MDSYRPRYPDGPHSHKSRQDDVRNPPSSRSSDMASNKRPGRDLSPRGAPDSKKAKTSQSIPIGPSNQKSRIPAKNDSATPGSARPAPTAPRALLASHGIPSLPTSRSSGSVHGSRPISPTRGRPTQNASGSAGDKSSRPPLKINTESRQTVSSRSGSPTKARSARVASIPNVDQGSLSPVKANEASKRAAKGVDSPVVDSKHDGRNTVVSHTPWCGPASMAPMVRSPATATSTTATSATATSAAANSAKGESAEIAKSPSLAPPAQETGACLRDIFALYDRYTTVSKERDDSQQRLQGIKSQAPSGMENPETVAMKESRIQSLQKEYQDKNEEAMLLEKRFEMQVSAFQSCVEKNSSVHVTNEVAELFRMVKALEKRIDSKNAKAKAVLSPLHVSETSENGATSDALEAKIIQIVEARFGLKKVKFKAILASIENSRDSTPKPLASDESPQKQSELTKHISCLQEENSTLREELAKHQNAIAKLESEKVDMMKTTSSLEEKFQSLSSNLGDVLSLAEAVRKLQADGGALAEDMRSFRKDVASRKDLLKKASSAQIVEATSQTDTLRKDLDTLTKRVQNLQSSTELSQLKADFTKFKEEHGKELEQHEEYIGRFERDLQADNTRINEVNQDIGNLNAGLKNLQSKVRKIDFDLADLEDEVETHLFSANDGDPTKVKLIGGQASARQSESQRVTNTLNSHEKDLKILKSEVLERAGTSTSSDSSTLSSSLDHLKARLEVQQKTIDTTNSSVKNLGKISGDVKAVEKTIHDLENKLNSQLSSTKAETDGLKTHIDTLEVNQTSLHNKFEDTVSKVNALVKNDNIQKSLDTLKEKQTSLQSKVEKIDAEIGTIDPKSLLKDVATLKSENRSNARSVEELDRVLNGSKVATTSKGKAAQEHPGLLQQLDELKGGMDAIHRSIQSHKFSQSKANDTSTPQPGSSRQTPSSEVTSFEKRFGRLEREVATVKRTVDALKTDFDGFEEALTQQSELIEADIKRRIEEEVAKAIPTDHPALTARHTTSNIKEIEEVVFPKLQRSASTMFNEELLGVNNHLSSLSKSLELQKAEYPTQHAEALADMVLFSQTHGKLSSFLPATMNSIRDLQQRFDNVQTREMAMNMLNTLLPHINNQLVPTIANMVLTPVKDLLAPYLQNQLQPHVQKELSSMRQRIEGASRNNIELENRNQLLCEEQQALGVRMGELEQRIAVQATTADTLIKNMRDERNAINLQMARLIGDIQHTQQVCTRLDGSIKEGLEKQSQECTRLHESLREQMEKQAQELAESHASLKEQVKKHQSFSADLKEHETEVWKQLKTDREQIDQLCDDIGEIHGCVGQVARRVDVALVPHHWVGIA